MKSSLPARGSLLLGARYADALAALGSATSEDGTTAFRLHSSTESVSALAAFIMGLIRAFHDMFSVLKRAQIDIRAHYLCQVVIENLPNPDAHNIDFFSYPLTTFRYSLLE